MTLPGAPGTNKFVIYTTQSGGSGPLPPTSIYASTPPGSASAPRPGIDEKHKIVMETLTSWSQSCQTLISSYFRFLLLSLALLKYRQYFFTLQTLKLNSKKREKSSFYKENSLVGLTPTKIVK
jgi:hypothetical protein